MLQISQQRKNINEVENVNLLWNSQYTLNFGAFCNTVLFVHEYYKYQEAAADIDDEERDDENEAY